MLKRIALLVLDRFLESENRFGAVDFDRKEVAGIIAEDETVELEDAWHGIV